MKASVGFPVICLFLFTFTGLAVNAQLKADFSANTISGCAPLIVKFSDQSLGGPTQWKWDLGNGTISFLQNPSASYFNPGQYTIKLVIRSGASVDSVVKTQFINVSAKPQVEFTASATNGCFPLPVQFRDNSTPGSGSIVSWQWDFGDGISSAEQHPQHTYSSAGSFNVTLRVFNSTGCLTTVSKSQYIQINSGVKAGFENSVPNVCSPPVLINFQNTSVGTGPLTYAWNFGDGTVSGEVNPSHSYTSAGNYQVELVVTNVTGCRDTLIKPGAINAGAVRPAFSAADQVCAGAPLYFTNNSSPAPVSATWDFGDGSGSSETSAVKRYLLPGTFRVKMIANFGSCFDSVFQTITVLSKPVALFTVTDSTSCKAPFRVNFVNQSLDGMRFEWRFGDTITSLLPAPTHTFQTYGNYNVQLTATGSNGCQDSLVRTSFIRITPPEAVLVNLPDSGCAPFTKTFSAGIVSVDPVTKYQWDFGDGSASSAISPTHSYTVPGVYTIRLVVTTAGGCTDTVIKQAGIAVTARPVAKFVATPRDACATAGVKFIDESSGAPFRWRWEFGDGSISTLQNPSHAYTDTGYFDVQLIVWNTGCSDTVTYREYIHIKPPVARFSFLSNCTKPYERVFTDQSIGADDWEWDFGDGNTSTQQNPVHIYSSPGEYSVSLVVHNNTTGCDYTSRKRVHVVDIKPGFDAPDTAVCKGTNVNFTTNLSLTEVSRFNWDFGDGTIVDSITNSASHSYKLAGTYSVTLITTDILGCSDTVAKPMYMQVNGPTAGFTSSVPGTCQENTVFFNDQSTSDGTHALKSWSWNYADGHMETLPTPSGRHTYSTAGTYSVSLVVTDSKGCVDSTQLPSALVISKPAANFTTADTLGCQGKAITFTNQSVGPNLQYRWNFGDGTTTTEPHPAHTYTVDGTYPVKLVVTDQYGCIDSLTRPGYVNITTSVANFNMSDSFSTCPPLIVQFTNLSTNAVSQVWDFGDGSTATVDNPSHFYSYPGTYIITLTIRGKGGCTEVKQKNIVINGPTGSFTYNPLNGCNPVTVNFAATTKDRISFIWDFNNGVTFVTTDSIISHTYTNQGRYIPKMILVDPNGCQVPVTGKDTIQVSGVIANFTFPRNTLCNRGTINFSDSTFSNDLITSYQWFYGDGSSTLGKDPSHFYAAPGLYFPKLVVTTKNGCIDSASASTPVKVVASPQADFTKSGNGCTPLVVSFNGLLTATDTAAVTWKWDFKNGNRSTQQVPPVQSFIHSGIYDVALTVTNSSGCTDTVIKPVSAFIIPAVNAGPDTTICRDIGVMLTATGANNYRWSPATGLSCVDCPNPVATPDSLARYIVRGTSGEGCSADDTILVKVKYPFTIKVSKGDTLCKGQNTKLFATGADRYEWSPSTGLNNANLDLPEARPDTSVIYRVIGSDYKGCFRDTGYVPLKVYPIPTVNAGADQTINIGQTIDLVPVFSADVTTVIWSPTGAIFRNNYPAITVKPNANTEYTVEVQNRGGCMTRDKVNVFVVCNGSNVFIPNTFSPNGDGANDVFFPRGTGLFKIKTLKIFNRWGQLVFERNSFNANDPALGWDGSFKGVKLPPDVFVYMIDIICDNNSILTFKGNIALIQ